jgi:hypothetical protein
MSEELTPAEQLEADGGTQPAVDPQTTTPPAGSVDSTEEESKLKKARSEAAKNRKRAQEAEATLAEVLARVEAIEAASAAAQAALDEQKAKAAQRLFDAQLTQVGTERGVADAEILAALVDKRKADLVLDDDGVPTNLGDIVDEILTEKPLLQGKPAASTGAGATPASQRQGKITLKSLEGKTAAELAPLLRDPETRAQVADALRSQNIG